MRNKYLYKNIFFSKYFQKFINKIVNETIFIFTLILFTPFLYLNRLLPSFLRLHFAGFRSERIGHFMTGFHILYAKKKLGLIDKNCIYYLNPKISNQFLANQVKKEFITYKFVRYIVRVCEKLPFLKCLVDRETITADIDKEGIITKTDMPRFTKKENAFAWRWLEKNGWEGPKQKIVCLHVRDNEYMNTYFKEHNWDNHSCRNANIDDFNDVISWLIHKGIFVIRVGKVAKNPLSIKSKSLVDYPFCEEQNDLLDIWLMANSSLVICTSSGFPEIAYGYKVPIIFVNHVPIGQAHSWKRALVIGKHLIWEETNKHLDLDEYLKLHDCHNTPDYDNQKIIIKDLSKKELMDTIKDGYKYFVEGKPFKKEDVLLTKKYIDRIINSKDDIKNYHH